MGHLGSTITPMKRPTITDVALACGLSKTTISKVMNVPASELDVPESTRQRVLDVAAKIGYRPSWRAKAFASRCTRTIGLLHHMQPEPMFRGDLWYDIVFALSARIYEAGYDVQLVGTSPAKERWRHMLLDQRLDGCVVFNWLTDHVAEALNEAQLPTVLLNAEAKGDWTAVLPDELHSAMELAHHLFSMGHRRVVLLDDDYPSPHFSLHRRLEGIAKGMQEAGGKDKPVLIRATPAEAMEKILAMPKSSRPTVIVAYNEQVALPLLHACWRAGVRVPQDMSVATFNDVPGISHSIPPLTAVAIPAGEMAARAVELLLARVEAKSNASTLRSQRVVLPGRLVPRESTGPAPKER